MLRWAGYGAAVCGAAACAWAAMVSLEAPRQSDGGVAAAGTQQKAPLPKICLMQMSKPRLGKSSASDRRRRRVAAQALWALRAKHATAWEHSRAGIAADFRDIHEGAATNASDSGGSPPTAAKKLVDENTSHSHVRQGEEPPPAAPRKSYTFLQTSTVIHEVGNGHAHVVVPTVVPTSARESEPSHPPYHGPRLRRKASWPPQMSAPLPWAAWSCIGALALLASAAARLAGRLAAALVARVWRRKATDVCCQAGQVHAYTGVELGGLFTETAPGLLEPGILVRVRGKVIAPAGQGLIAPLSGRPCVLYSASVSHRCHDGVHPPPVAFDSNAVDFEVELRGSPPVRLAIDGRNCTLFDTVGGKHGGQATLAGASEAWRVFVLAHLIPGLQVPGCLTGTTTGAEDPLLDYAEVALVPGVEVTCIGEACRTACGRLELRPWNPGSAGAETAAPAPGAMTPWEQEAKPGGGAGGVLAGRVMLSDNPGLFRHG